MVSDQRSLDMSTSSDEPNEKRNTVKKVAPKNRAVKQASAGSGNRASGSEDVPSRFDDVLKELTQVVSVLENPDVPLEDSLAAFERGVVLSKHGQHILDTAEKKVSVLLSNGKTTALENDDFSDA